MELNSVNIKLLYDDNGKNLQDIIEKYLGKTCKNFSKTLETMGKFPYNSTVARFAQRYFILHILRQHAVHNFVFKCSKLRNGSLTGR